jgi:hypothetical protein
LAFAWGVASVTGSSYLSTTGCVLGLRVSGYLGSAFEDGAEKMISPTSCRLSSVSSCREEEALAFSSLFTVVDAASVVELCLSML